MQKKMENYEQCRKRERLYYILMEQKELGWFVLPFLSRLNLISRATQQNFNTQWQEHNKHKG